MKSKGKETNYWMQAIVLVFKKIHWEKQNPTKSKNDKENKVNHAKPHPNKSWTPPTTFMLIMENFKFTRIF